MAQVEAPQGTGDLTFVRLKTTNAMKTGASGPSTVWTVTSPTADNVSPINFASDLALTTGPEDCMQILFSR